MGVGRPLPRASRQRRQAAVGRRRSANAARPDAAIRPASAGRFRQVRTRARARQPPQRRHVQAAARDRCAAPAGLWLHSTTGGAGAAGRAATGDAACSAGTFCRPSCGWLCARSGGPADGHGGGPPGRVGARNSREPCLNAGTNGAGKTSSAGAAATIRWRYRIGLPPQWCDATPVRWAMRGDGSCGVPPERKRAATVPRTLLVWPRAAAFIGQSSEL